MQNICRSQKEREKIDLRGRVITTMDRELSALRTGRKLSDRQGNENLSVKNLIASIEHQVRLLNLTSRKCSTSLLFFNPHKTSCPIAMQEILCCAKTAVLGFQVKTVGTPPLSPSTLTSQNTSRRSSMDSTSSGRSMGGESPTKPEQKLDRRSSVPADMQLKSLLRKPNGENKDPRQPLAHRHGVSNIIYEKAPPMKEETRLSPPGGKPDAVDGKPKPTLKGILTDKSASRKNSNK